MEKRNLVVILGDQLDYHSAALDGFDPASDVVFMAEVAGEAQHVPSHKMRIALFFSAMRHFAEELRARDIPVEYRKLDAPDNREVLADELIQALKKLKPRRVVVVEPGEYRIQETLNSACQLWSELEIRTDRHFFCQPEEFAQWAKGRKQLRMEYFYRDMRKRHNVLMDKKGQPVGGAWNFDAENRGSFGKSGPPFLTPPRAFPKDKITEEVLQLVEARFPNHPGSLEHFDLPVTAAQAEQALDDFLRHRLPYFGEFQDAMWTGEPFLYHSRLSAALNLKLITPHKVVASAEKLFQEGKAPLPAVEGFIRQIIGWREYVRGIYWTYMPQYAESNALQAHEPLPDFYWDGKTDMNCLRETVGQLLEYGYAHHIQRLMVTGLFALLWAADPFELHKWYLAMYYDAVEWVELPNTIGMSQFADGGLMASKPYAATGKYIARMSNYCQGCRYKPDSSCPFTILYWEFLMRHEETLSKNQRMSLQVKNLARLTAARKAQILDQAKAIRASIPSGRY